MTLIEACLLTLTVAMLAMAVTLLVVILRLRSMTALLGDLIQDTRGSVRRIDELGSEIQGLVHQARVDYRAVSQTTRQVVDTVIQPARGALSLLTGLRAAAGFLLRPRTAASASTQNSTPYERSFQ